MHGPPCRRGRSPGADNLEALQAHGLSAAEAGGGFRIDGGRQAVIGLLDSRPALTAVVIANNMMTLGGLQVSRLGAFGFRGTRLW